MERLTLKEISSKIVDELLAEDRRLINAVVNSGITRLTYLLIGNNATWFFNRESQSYLLDFIKH